MQIEEEKKCESSKKKDRTNGSSSKKKERKSKEKFSVKLFSDDIIVESDSGESSQAHVYFGREASLGIRVVLKQFIGSDKSSFVSEIKVFSLIESLRNEQSGGELKHVIEKSKNLETLPVMLGYKTSKQFSEVLVAHSGNSLERWISYI